MRKAAIGKDGWIRCPLYSSKLARVDGEGIKLWCSHDKSEVLIPFDVLISLCEKHNK